MRELAPLLEHALVRDVHALPPADLLLVLEPAGGGRILRLRLSADPEAARVHLQHERIELHKGPLGPFFRRLADELPGAELASFAQVRGDRILRFEFRGGKLPERRALLAELVGRHSNLAWLGREDRVLELLVQAKPGKAVARLLPGHPWVPPPGSPPKGEPAPLACALPDPARDPESCAGLAPLSWRVESALGGQAELARADSERRTLHERVARRLERARALHKGLEKRRSAAAESGNAREEGELLKANFTQLARGMKEIEVEDFLAEGTPRRRIALDPKLSPQENLQRAFDRARKLERTSAAVEGEIALAAERVAALEALADEARTSPDPLALDARAVAEGLLEARQIGDPRKRPDAPAARLPYRAFTGAGGSEIRVGRTAKDNDELSFRHARGNDMWLHTADAPGSHVVLRLEARSEADPEDLLDAAHLALHFSPLRGARRARLHVARCKEVHKPRGAKPGLVQLSGGKSLEIRVQPERLERLLGTRRGPAGGEEAASGAA
ncbi:MAG: NFACT family protein [Planctomycetes bacterium]|nr:NFACT family protein [Planctomycetota bacterium]